MSMGSARGFAALQGTRRAWPLISETRKAESKSTWPFLSFLIVTRLVKKLAIKSDVVLENFKPGSKSSHPIRGDLFSLK